MPKINMEEENNYLKNTLKVLKEIISKNNISIEEAKKHVNEVQNYVWDNITDLDPTEIEFAKSDLEKAIEIGNKNIVETLVLNKMLDNTYFGRIDFQSENYHKVYIGISSIIDEKYNIFVYDWRTPIASMYYDYEIGNASYEAPIGKIEGKITLKRQYKIENRKIIYAFDNNLNVSDTILQDVLGNNTSENMKNIVNTIQKEQNKVIRDIKNKYLIVEGPAGCGKTSVALHRIAYLLYKFRNQLNSNEVLIFSPNKVFSNYISHVLPVLGEKNAVHTEFSTYINKYITEYNRVEHYMNFIERLYNKNYYNMFIQIKMNHKFHEAVDIYIEDYIKNLKFKNIEIDGYIVLSKEQCEKIIQTDLKKYPILTSLKRLKDYACLKYRHASYKKVNIAGLDSLVKRQIPDYLEIKRIFINMFSNEAFLKKIKELYNIDIEKFSKISIKNLNSDIIRYEDAIIFAYFKGKVAGFPYDIQMKQVIIDEGQDYTKMQYFIIKSIFKRANFTILGDSNQAVNPVFEYKKLDELDDIFENKSILLNLKTTYRNTFEITNYCNNIIKLNNINPVNRHGLEPKKILGDITDLISLISENHNYKTAIIVKNQSEANNLINILKENKFNINAYRKSKITDKVIVLPVYYAKGLEFDAVIVVNEEKFEKKNYYVACTRALHKLDIFNFKNMI